MAAEWQKPLREFEISTNLSPLEERVIEELKPATRIAADMFLALSPTFWYGQAFRGNFDSDEFRKEYLIHSATNLKINDPYSYLDSKWNPIPIINNREISKQMGRMSEYVLVASNEINRMSGKDETAFKFAEHLRRVVGYCLDGNFDGLMKTTVEQDQTFSVGWHFTIAEPYNDPMKIRPVPQSSLHLKDKIGTNNATEMVSKLKDASKKLSKEIGYSVVPRDAQIVVANVLMLSGYFAEVNTETSKFREPSGFNLPNDPTLTDKSLIVIFKGRIAGKNQQLSQKLQEYLGICSKPADLMALVTGHEHAHGYHEGKDELHRYGLYNQVMRELMANDLAATLVGSKTFSDDLQRKFVRGLLAYSVDDVQGRITVIKDPRATKGIDINLLMEEVGDYGLVGLITLRESIDSGAIRLNAGKPASIDYQRLLKQAKDRFSEESYLAKEGNPDKTERFLKEYLYGLRLYPVIKPEALAS